MKTEFSDSTLGIMRLFNNEEYYKYSVEVFSSLNASALKCGIVFRSVEQPKTIRNIQT